MNMKLSILRKIYPYLSSDIKSIKWRSLSDPELNQAMKDPQIIANCFDEATRYALLASEKGRELLKNRIKIQKGENILPAYKLKLNVNGKDEVYKSTKIDYFSSSSDLYNDYYNISRGGLNFENSKVRLSLGVNIAVCKLVKKHPSMKPFLSRLYMFPIIVNRACEYNKPSNAFKWFTGKTPISYGEEITSLSLKKHKKQVLYLLNDLGNKESKDYSFVAVTGCKKIKEISSWHTLPIISVDSKNKTLKILDKRTNNMTNISFDDFINSFKSIIGIKWN